MRHLAILALTFFGTVGACTSTSPNTERADAGAGTKPHGSPNDEASTPMRDAPGSVREAGAGGPAHYDQPEASISPQESDAGAETADDDVTNDDELTTEEAGSTETDRGPTETEPSTSDDVPGPGPTTELGEAGPEPTPMPGPNTDAVSVIKIPLEWSAGVSIALDDEGGIHAAGTRKDGNVVSAYYAHCAHDCELEDSWKILVFGPGSAPNGPYLARGNDGHLYVGLYSYDPQGESDPAGNTTGHWFFECDADCDDEANWSGLHLTAQASGDLSTVPPHEPFAVSKDGAVTYLYATLTETNLLYCPGDCSNDNWELLGLPEFDGTFDPSSIRIADDGQIQMAGAVWGADDNRLVWLSCSSECEDPSSWISQEDLWVTDTGSGILPSLALTRDGSPRIALQAHGGVNNSLAWGYLSCDQDCGSAGNWSLTHPDLPLDVFMNQVTLALDDSARPIIVYRVASSISYATCSGSCSAPDDFTQVASLDGTELESLIPFDTRSGCGIGYYALNYGPSVALKEGHPVVGFSGAEELTNANCVTDANQTFLLLP
jgi:hypothetical protein